MKEGITSYNIEDINTKVEKIFIINLIDQLVNSKGIRYNFKPISKDNTIVGLVLKLGDTDDRESR